MSEIRPELAQAMDDYQQAFIRWAVAAYAVAIEPSTPIAAANVQRLARLKDERQRARWNRDDAHIEFVAALFTWGNDNDDPLPSNDE